MWNRLEVLGTAEKACCPGGSPQLWKAQGTDSPFSRLGFSGSRVLSEDPRPENGTPIPLRREVKPWVFRHGFLLWLLPPNPDGLEWGRHCLAEPHILSTTAQYQNLPIPLLYSVNQNLLIHHSQRSLWCATQFLIFSSFHSLIAPITLIESPKLINNFLN